MIEEVDLGPKHHCQCGIPLPNEDDICVACLPPQFRMTIGRQAIWYQPILEESNE